MTVYYLIGYPNVGKATTMKAMTKMGQSAITYTNYDFTSLLEPSLGHAKPKDYDMYSGRVYMLKRQIVNSIIENRQKNQNYIFTDFLVEEQLRTITIMEKLASELETELEIVSLICDFEEHLKRKDSSNNRINNSDWQSSLELTPISRGTAERFGNYREIDTTFKTPKAVACEILNLEYVPTAFKSDLKKCKKRKYKNSVKQNSEVCSEHTETVNMEIIQGVMFALFLIMIAYASIIFMLFIIIE